MHDEQVASNGFASLERKIDALAEAVLRLDQKVSQLDRKVSQLDQRVSQLDQRVSQLERKVSQLDERVSTGFREFGDRFAKVEERITDVEKALTKVQIALEGVEQQSKNIVDSLNGFRTEVVKRFDEAEDTGKKEFAIVHKAIHYWGAEVTRVAAASLH